MPLQGNIRDFSTTQLLNLVNLSRRTGTLIIFEAKPTGEKDEMGNQKMAAGAERAVIGFNKGKLVYAALSNQDSGLVSILNKAGKLTDDQARLIKARAGQTADKALAMRLIGAKYVTQADIVSCIKQHILDVVFNLMTWKEGPFRFDDNVLPGQGKDHILVPIELEQVILDGAKRMREIDELNKHIENLDMALRFPENPKEKFKGIHLSVEEWKVVSYVSPKNTIRQIAKANNMSEIEIRRIVYGLEQAGLVQIVKPESTAKQTKTSSRRAAARSRQKPEVQKQVVNRLIDKLKSL